jgi:arginase family enzyme
VTPKAPLLAMMEDCFNICPGDVHLVREVVAEAGKLVGMDVVEVNPILDVRNEIARLAVEFVRSALGSRVWSG